MKADDKEPSFGAYRLGTTQKILRKISNSMPEKKPGKWITSFLRRLLLLGNQQVFDVSLSETLHVRLRPKDNLCEKRVFAAYKHWNSMELNALYNALEQHKSKRPFTFLDVGGNVGFYSIFLADKAKKIQKPTNIITVEPDPINTRRLQFNTQASAVELTHDAHGIAGKSGRAILKGGHKNRGEIYLESTDDKKVGIDIITLVELCAIYGLDQIDALKLDIEGHDLDALTEFFDSAPKKLFPSLMVLETRKSESGVLELAIKNGYKLLGRKGINSVVTL